MKKISTKCCRCANYGYLENPEYQIGRSYNKVQGTKNKYPLFTIYCLLFTIYFLMNGCTRNPFNNEIIFRGKVYLGVETSDGKLEVKGPLPNARVSLLGYNTSVLTDATGGYSITIESIRKFNLIYPDLESFTIEATGTSSSSNYPTGNYLSEKIIVGAKPGDKIDVKDLILYAYRTN